MLPKGASLSAALKALPIGQAFHTIEDARPDLTISAVLCGGIDFRHVFAGDPHSAITWGTFGGDHLRTFLAQAWPIICPLATSGKGFLQLFAFFLQAYTVPYPF